MKFIYTFVIFAFCSENAYAKKPIEAKSIATKATESFQAAHFNSDNFICFKGKAYNVYSTSLNNAVVKDGRLDERSVGKLVAAFSSIAEGSQTTVIGVKGYVSKYNGILYLTNRPFKKSYLSNLFKFVKNLASTVNSKVLKKAEESAQDKKVAPLMENIAKVIFSDATIKACSEFMSDIQKKFKGNKRNDSEDEAQSNDSKDKSKKVEKKPFGARVVSGMQSIVGIAQEGASLAKSVDIEASCRAADKKLAVIASGKPEEQGAKVTALLLNEVAPDMIDKPEEVVTALAEGYTELKTAFGVSAEKLSAKDVRAFVNIVLRGKYAFDVASGCVSKVNEIISCVPEDKCTKLAGLLNEIVPGVAGNSDKDKISAKDVESFISNVVSGKRAVNRIVAVINFPSKIKGFVFSVFKGNVQVSAQKANMELSRVKDVTSDDKSSTAQETALVLQNSNKEVQNFYMKDRVLRAVGSHKVKSIVIVFGSLAVASMSYMFGII